MNKPWNQQELNYLKENYPKIGAVGCCLTNRSITAIRSQADRLKLVRGLLIFDPPLNKICPKCKIDKNINDFYDCKNHLKDNKSKFCKKCVGILGKAYRLKNKFKIKHSRKLFSQTQSYKDSVNKKQKLLKITNPNYRILTNLRSRISIGLRRGIKSKPTRELLGCSIDELRAHLERQFTAGMTWDNYGVKGWHIDHRKPCASFDLTMPEQQKICFHYTNLQPLWAKDNLSKGDKLIY